MSVKHNKLVFLVSAMDRIDNFFLSLPEQKKDVEFLICHQTKGISPTSLRDDVKVFSMNEFGLSKSRNFILSKFFSEYTDSVGVITDDDVGFLNGSYDNFAKLFDSLKCDFITIKVATPEGSVFKDYSKKKFQHTRRSVTNVSSIEILLHSSVQMKLNNCIFFDEDFGLGSRFKLGEEAIFLDDLIKKGIKGFYYPITMFVHPKESTGSSIDEQWIIAKGAYYKRRYGLLLGILLLARLIVNNFYRIKKSKKVSLVAVLKSFFILITYKRNSR